MKTLLIAFMLVWTALASGQTISGGLPNNATRLTNPAFYAYSNTNIIYWFPTATTNYSGINEIGGAQLYNSSNTFAPLIMSFVCSNAPAIEFESCNATYGVGQVEVSDGMTNYFSPVTAAAPGGTNDWYFYPNSNPTLYLVTMPYTTNWQVTIWLACGPPGSGLIAGINLPTNSVFLPTNTFTPQRRVVVYGDSYAQGYEPDNQSHWLYGFAQDLVQMGSNVKIMESGVGGQGYTNVYDGGNYQTRLTNDLFNVAPQFVIVTGSINDNGFTTNQVYQAANLLYGTIVSNLPSANIAVVGTWYKDSTPNSSMIANDQMQQAAAAAWGLHYVSPVQQLWGQGGTSVDSVHPSVSTYLTYAQDISTNMYAWYGTNWITNTTPPPPPPSTEPMAIRWK
jgi:lysophospholipase L1-like esterase